MKRLRESWERAKAVGLSDKGDVHSYLEVYDFLFANFNKVRLLEVGVQSGASLAMFKDYFGPGSVVHGIEIQPITNTLDGVAVFFGNAYTNDMVSVLGQYDIIIDDGSHNFDDVQFFIQNYFENLSDGGILVVEDIQPDFDIASLYNSLPSKYRPHAFTVDCRQAKGRNDDVMFVARKVVA